MAPPIAPENLTYIKGAINVSAKTQVVTLQARFWAWGSSHYAVFDWSTTYSPIHVNWGPYRIGAGGGTDGYGPWDDDTNAWYSLPIDGLTHVNYTDRSPSSAEPAANYPGLTCDRTYFCRPWTYCLSNSGGALQAYGLISSLKTDPALNATASVVTVGSITKNSAVLTGTYTPNTYETGATVYVKHKKSIDSVNAVEFTKITPVYGYSPIGYTVTLSGLEPDTPYDVWVDIWRPTTINTIYNAPSWQSFRTLAGAPDTPTTLPATSIGGVAATLNASILVHSVPTTVSFQYGTAPGTYTGSTTGVVLSGDPSGVGALEYTAQGISGLSYSTPYYFRAKAVYASGTLYGSELSFTTDADPGITLLQQATEEEHMQTIQFDGQYATGKTVYFTLRQPAASSSNLFYTGTAPVYTTDVKIYRNGAFLNYATNAVDGTNAPIYSLTLTTTEMTGETIDVWIHDSDATAFRDAHVQVRTAQRLSEIDVDATNGPTNASALTLIGHGTGLGLSATGGTTATALGHDIKGILYSNYLLVGTSAGATGTTLSLGATASGTADFYNGAIVAIVGGTVTAAIGQARVITDYSGTAAYQATVSPAWTTNPTSGAIYAIIPAVSTWDNSPGTELAAVPTAADTYGKMIQLIFQRFAYAIDQDASLQQWYDEAGTSVVFQRTVVDTGTLQSLGKLTT